MSWGGDAGREGFAAAKAELGEVAGEESWDIIAFQHEGLETGGGCGAGAPREIEICVRDAELV